MIQISGNEIKRDDVKIGWIEGDHIFNHDGKRVGTFADNKIWNAADTKIAYIEGEYVYLENGRDKIRIEDNMKEVAGGTISDLCRAAIRLLLG